MSSPTSVLSSVSKDRSRSYSQDFALAGIGQADAIKAAVAGALVRAGEEVQRLKSEYADGSLPLLRIVEDTADIDDAVQALDKLSEGAELLIFFGTGGSSLGGQTLAQFAGWSIPGQMALDQKKRPRTRFYDNLDAATLDKALEANRLGKTRFVVTSKSGGTTETLAQAMSAISAVDAAADADKVPELFLGVTEPDKPGKRNGLRDLFAARGIPMLEHHTGIGGRYSCLTNVGLIPAMARGVDAYEVRAGAQSVIAELLAAEAPEQSAAAVGAAHMVALMETQGIRNLVMMPYDDRLGRFSAWFVQLWAESLGKDGKGSTPMACLGPLDQHSQLQLFMDGPREHVVTIMRTGDAPELPKIDAEMAKLAGVDFMGGRSVADVVKAQSHAVPEALVKAGRPVRTMDIPRLDAFAMGALLMHFMIETILAGRMIGIDPFDQPAVELAKVLTRERLSAGG
ncbi:MAG: glucose-6-phosphate isomerase [Pseudomonadota bacterium]